MQAPLDMACVRDRYVARQVGYEAAVVEIALGGGNGGGAGHRTSRNGQGADQTLGYDNTRVRGRERCKGCRRSSKGGRPSAWRPVSPLPKGRSITPTGSIISSMCERAS